MDIMNDLVGDREPEIRSGFYDVHFVDDALIYVKAPCIWDDVQHHLYLYLTPADGSYLSEEGSLYGFDQLGFDFWERDVAADSDACVARVDLPGYEIASIRTMQLTGNQGIVWDSSYSIHTVGAFDAVTEFRRQGRRPEISSDFDVFVDGGRLFYHKQPCYQQDIDARFFLHVVPANTADLPLERRESGFDNLDFSLWQEGGRVGDECFAKADLPEYEITEIKTGQLTHEERIWEGSIDFMEQWNP